MGDGRVVAEGQGVEGEGATYRAYRRRFAMAVTVMLLNVCNAGLCFNLASVAYKAADYFEATLPQINWFSEVYLVAPFMFFLVSTFTFNKFGVKAGIHLGSALNCVGALTRALATSGLINKASTQYAVSLTGQVAAAIGSTYLAFISTKVAQNWFPDEERMMATTAVTFSPALGISVAQVVSPLLVPETQQLPTLNYAYAGLAVLCELVAVVCVTRSRPPTPPSRSAEQGEAKRAPFLQQLKDTLTCLPFLGMLLMTAIIVATFLSISTLTQQILCSMGYSDLFSGATVTTFVVAGLVGSLTIAVVAIRTKALTPIVKFSYAFGVVCAVVMMEMYLVPDQSVLLLIAASLFGFFCNGVFALSLEMGVETTYPVEETISATLMYVTGQVLGVLMTNAVVYFSSDLPRSLEGVEVCTAGLTSDLEARDYSAPITGVMVVLSVIVILFVPLFHTPYKRQQAG